MADRLRDRGYEVIRSAGSHSEADLWAAKDGKLMLVQVKANARSPWSGFGPADRQTLSEAARRAGGTAVMIWYPYDRQGPRWLYEPDWPPS